MRKSFNSNPNLEQIIDLCKKINIKVVAEGVEDKELADKLRE